MNIEQIKKELEQWATDATNVPYNAAYLIDGANHVLTTYYTPLEASHRELYNLLTMTQEDIQFNKWMELKESAINNAKSLINE